MKHLFTLATLLLIVACLLCACGNTDEALNGEKREIVDVSFSEDAAYPSAIEYFWSDEQYHYVFPSIMAWDCTVTYEGGMSENLVDALDAGRVTVADMQAHGLPFWREPVRDEIKEIRYEGGDSDIVADLLCVTEDSEYWYFMGGEREFYVVEYVTGAVEPLVPALRDGRVTIDDLDRFEVPYLKEAIGE